MLKVENVTKYYGDFLAVDNLSFTVKPGEIFGLLGVNGAGKTTTFRMIMGLLEPSSGKITLDGKPIDYSVTDKIGFLTEERSLLTKMTVLEQCKFYGALKGMSDEDILKRVDYLLEKFGVSEYKNKKIKELSKGNQQKIQFITAIINEPKLLILDLSMRDIPMKDLTEVAALCDPSVKIVIGKDIICNIGLINVFIRAIITQKNIKNNVAKSILIGNSQKSRTFAAQSAVNDRR